MWTAEMVRELANTPTPDSKREDGILKRRDGDEAFVERITMKAMQAAEGGKDRVYIKPREMNTNREQRLKTLGYEVHLYVPMHWSEIESGHSKTYWISWA